MEIVNQLVSLGFVTVLFALMYRILPSTRVAWRDVWQGSLVTAVLFTIGKFLIGLYLGKAGVASGFGAAGSIVVLLVWVFYSAQIFLLGAEFTWVYAHREGSRAADASAVGQAASPSPRRSEAERSPAPVPAAEPGTSRAARGRAAAPRTARARDMATAALVWIGFGAVRSLFGGRSRQKMNN
jgi:membrane protein